MSDESGGVPRPASEADPVDQDVLEDGGGFDFGFDVVGEPATHVGRLEDDTLDEPVLTSADEDDDEFAEEYYEDEVPAPPPRDELLRGVSVDEEELAEQAVEAEEAGLPEGRFADRELSWLAFNQRVIEQAEDPGLPLLERAWFLAIFASNLDEFFMVRVAGLKRRIATGLAVTAASGLTPRQVLEGIALKAHELTTRHARAFQEDVGPGLAEEGIQLLHFQDLSDSEKKRLEDFYRRQIFPVLTPLAVDPAHPFPYISGLSLNLAVVVRNPSTGKEFFARVKVPPLLPRFIAVDATGKPRRPEDIALQRGKTINEVVGKVKVAEGSAAAPAEAPAVAGE